MTYQQTLDFLFSQLPMYQRVGKSAYRADLKNTHALMDLLDHPEKKFKSIHVAGTNGKGSVSHLLASALQEQGYKTGLYTSPHLVDFRERIMINGAKCTEDFVVDFVGKYKEEWVNLNPSFFEITVAMAFEYFAKENVDIAVIEVGMGGRLDSTNVITPEISVITSIGLDHTAFLGDTIEKVAREKGGIIKEEVPVVVGKCDPTAQAVFLELSKARSAPIRYVDDYELRVPPTDLKGDFQKDNTATAYLALQQLIDKGWKIEPSAIERGFANVIRNTHLQGRWQILGKDPLVVCDCSHNPDGIAAAMAEVQKVNYRKLHFVLGMVNDKAIDEVLALLPKDARYYFAKADIPRGLDAKLLYEQALSVGLQGDYYPSVDSAFHSAQSHAQEEDLIFVGGSFFTVAEVLTLFH